MVSYYVSSAVQNDMRMVIREMIRMYHRGEDAVMLQNAVEVSRPTSINLATNTRAALNEVDADVEEYVKSLVIKDALACVQYNKS